MSDRLRYRVEGMDCASCAARIEKAVTRVPGVSDVAIAVATETMSVSLDEPGLSAEIERIVRDLGYEPRLLRSAAAPEHAGHGHDCCGHDHGENGHDHAGHDHGHGDHGHGEIEHAGHDHGPAHDHAHAAQTSHVDHAQDRDPAHDHDHGAPLEGPWWQSRKGRTVIATGVLIAAAFLASWAFPAAGMVIYGAASLAAGIPIAAHAVKAARYGSVFTIEMLMTIAVIGALAIGAAEEAAVVVFLFAVGELLEGIAAGRARAGIRALARIAPVSAMVESGDGLVETPVERIRVGAVVVARPGDRVAADGTVLTGGSSVDESALTGESVPRSKAAGDPVFAGSINLESALRIRVEKPASDTLIARVVRLVEEAAETKAPTERFIDRFARAYMPAICVLALAVAVLPPIALGQDWFTWIYRGLTLLLIGCPCALVISTPAAIASALAAGARQGLLVKGGAVLETIGKVRTIALDKTGTLTEGRPRVTDVLILDPALEEREVLRLAAAIEAASSHPLAVAIVSLAKERGVVVSASAGSQVLPGRGVRGEVDGHVVLVGAPDRLGVDDAQVSETVASLQRDGKTVSAVVLDGRPVALLALRDEPRADAREGLDAIKALGIRPVMLTGDNGPTGEAVARALGIEAMTSMLPEDKLRAVRDFARTGAVAKVGDGINDAPALAAADVGIAMGSGTDVALEAADAAILRNRVGDVAALVRLSRRTMAVIHQNVAIALGLKAVFLLTTIVGLTGLWIAILADTGATVLVTFNALRLLRRHESV